MGSVRKLLNQNAPEHSSGANEKLEDFLVQGSLQPKAEGSPTHEVAEADSFECLLPDVLRILSLGRYQPKS